MKLELHLTLLSDATIGRGDGVAGLVDEEVEHDNRTGLPFLRGRTLKGLLVEECANILFALKRQAAPTLLRLEKAALFLFGQAGSTLTDDAMLHVGAAQVPKELREAVVVAVDREKLTVAEVLESLTDIRRQTAVDDESGAPDEGSLRSMRVVLRETCFVAELTFAQLPSDDALGLLAGCVLGLRRAGTARNRGRGRVQARLCDDHGSDLTMPHFAYFRDLVEGGNG